jgi:pimeloyl-ACP methyl ester carboxylesterase
MAPLGEPAARVGIRIICPDRCGSGHSDPDPNLSFIGYSNDLRALLDRLGLPCVAIAGFSGGGGYALAAGGCLADRLTQVILLSAMVPDVHRSALAGLSPTNKAVRLLSRWSPPLVAWLLNKQLGSAFRQGPSGMERLLRTLPVPDQEALRRSGLAEYAADGVEALRQGPRAAAQELARYGRPLGAPLTSITTPVDVLHGDLDTNVPIGVAHWITGELPTATLTVVPASGHFFVLDDPQLLFSKVQRSR